MKVSWDYELPNGFDLPPPGGASWYREMFHCCPGDHRRVHLGPQQRSALGGATGAAADPAAGWQKSGSHEESLAGAERWNGENW